MKIYKRCACAETARCGHRFWFKFKLHGREYPSTTRTANRQLAERIGAKRRLDVLERREGWRAPKPVKFSEHLKAYFAHTAKANILSNKVSVFSTDSWPPWRRQARGVGFPRRALEARSCGCSQPIDGEPRTKHCPGLLFASS